MLILLSFFFFNDTATTEIYTLSLHDALPISYPVVGNHEYDSSATAVSYFNYFGPTAGDPTKGYYSFDLGARSEEHTSELQSRLHLVCRLLLEKKKQNATRTHNTADRAPKYTL